MGSMKVTVNLAMRARDVSRPRAEHMAEAAAREESVPPRVRPAPAVQPPPPRPGKASKSGQEPETGQAREGDQAAGTGQAPRARRRRRSR
ncbi:MAG TPA: hypothetical protein VF060_26480 [Trebonia sp.]